MSEDVQAANVRLVFDCEVSVFEGDDDGVLTREAMQAVIGGIVDPSDVEIEGVE